MANVGKCLLFYLKYPAEMERLYEDEEPDCEGLSDADVVLEQVKLVGDAAGREVAELFEACAPGIEGHLRTISTVERVRNNIEESWELRFRVSPKRSTRRFEVGVSLGGKGLCPWVWCRGGRRVEDEVIREIGRGRRPSTLGLDWYGGTVILDEVEISLPPSLDIPVPLEPLTTKAQQAFVPLTADHIRAISNLANT